MRTDELGERLVEIERRRAAEKPEHLEVDYLDLLSSHDSPEDRARIYTAIAVMFANDGMQEPAKVISYSREAIARGVDLIRACQLYVYWGEALEILRPAVPSELDAMRELLFPYLTGLRLTLGQSVTASTRQFPAVGKVDHDGPPSDGEHRQAYDRHRKEVGLRSEVELQNDVYRFRRLFVEKIRGVLERAPRFAAQLKGLAAELLGDEVAVTEILEKRSVGDRGIGE